MSQPFSQSKSEDDNNPLLLSVNETILPEQEELVSIPRLVALTLCFLGVQFGWAVQIAYASPIFLGLGVPKVWVSFVWLAGPISGLLVQPTAGVLSDRCTLSWGRRRPFIFFGAVFILVGMVLISNAATFGQWITGKEHSAVAIAIAVVGFWVLDLSNNTVQGPCRALLVDVAASSQQNLGGSLFSFMLGTGNLMGYFIGSLNLTKWFGFFGTDIRALFTCGMLVLAVCVAITLIFTKERPITPDEVRSTGNPFITLAKAIVRMPPGMVRVCLVQFFAWFGWFTFLLYITSWVGTNIFHGSSDSTASPALQQLFEQGVRFGSLGLTCFAGVTMALSVVYPLLTKWLGIKIVFCISQLVLGGCLIASWFVQTKWAALLLISLCGIPWTAVMVLPFTIVALNVAEEDCGMFMGVLNIFVVIPQIIVSVGIGFVIDLFNGNFAAALAVGGVAALVSAVMVWFLIIPAQKGGKEVHEDD